jgi:mitogen-activated protein kinase kinase
MKRKNVKGLALTPAAPKPPPTAENGPDYDGNNDGAGKDGQLEIGIEYKLDLRPDDLEVIKELGSGNGGTVSKVKHTTTGTVMARKVRIPRLCFFPPNLEKGLTDDICLNRSSTSMPRKRCESKLCVSCRLHIHATPTTLSHSTAPS